MVEHGSFWCFSVRFLGLALTGDVLARDRCFVQLELVEKLGFRSDVEVSVFAIHHSKPLGLSHSELRFCDPLDDDRGVGFGSVLHLVLVCL